MAKVGTHGRLLKIIGDDKIKYGLCSDGTILHKYFITGKWERWKIHTQGGEFTRITWDRLTGFYEVTRKK